MQVARCSYYAWGKRPPSEREKANAELTEQIKTAFKQNRETYGSPRLYQELRAQQIACSEKRVARLMRLANLKATWPKRFVATTDSSHGLPIAENLLDRQFSSETPDTRWSGDITSV
jgi:putative transposase